MVDKGSLRRTVVCLTLLGLVLMPGPAVAQVLPPTDATPASVGNANSAAAGTGQGAATAAGERFFAAVSEAAGGSGQGAQSRGRRRVGAGGGGEGGGGSGSGQGGQSAGQSSSRSALEQSSLPGYPNLSYQNNGLIKTEPGLTKAINALQSSTDGSGQTKAVGILQETIDQVDRALADTSLSGQIGSSICLREGKQCSATRNALTQSRSGQCTAGSLGTICSSATRSCSPILLDLDANGIADVTTPDVGGECGAFVKEGSVRFDISGRGVSQRTEWLKPNRDGLLAVDANSNGVVDSASELFGDTDGFDNGYAKLAVLDRDNNGVLTGDELSKLMVWVDDGDGVCQPSEMRTMNDLQISAISVDHRNLVSWYVKNGQTCTTWDWYPRVE